jgi:hypothetical protein
MRYKEFRILEQSAPGTVSIVVYFEDNTTQTIDNIPLSVFNGPDFMSQLRDRLSRKYNKIVVRYARVGDTTTQGNPDGNTPDTEVPTTLTTKQDTDAEINQRPDEVEVPVDDSNSVTWDGVMLVSASDLAAQHNAWADRVDANRDNKNDTTGEPVLRQDDNGNSVDAQGNPVGPQITLPRLGGGSEGEEGKGGEEGEEGSAGEAEDLAEKLYNAMHPAILGIEFTRADWWGTDEHDVVRAFRQIKNPQQLQLITKVYKERYGSTLGTQLASDYTNYISRFGGINKIQIRQLNEELNRLGYNMTVSSSGAVSIKKV